MLKIKMSDQIPFHIQVEIIKRLPVKSLVQFRSVSKPWKSLIDSSEFIADHSVRHDRSHHLIVGYQRFDPDLSFRIKTDHYVSFCDDHTFPQQRSAPAIPLLVDRFKESKIIGSSHGLLCLYGYYPEYNDSPSSDGKAMAVVWNPSIRKSVAISVPHVLPNTYTTVGFGVCPGTSDYKLVKIICMYSETEIKTSIPWQVEVFTSSSSAWRTQLSNLPRKSVMFTWRQVVIDGFIYFLAIETINKNGGSCSDDLIMSFDLSNDEFREVELPVSLKQNPGPSLSIWKLRESLALVQYGVDSMIRTCGVWVMEHGSPNSFTKLFTIKAPGDLWMEFMEFRKSGEAITSLTRMSRDVPSTLAVFKSYSGRFSDLGIYANYCSIDVKSYMETLLLLNQQDGTSYLDQDSG